MKNEIIKIGFIGLLLLTVFASCYDDKSTLASVEYPDVVAGRTGEGRYLAATYGEQFEYVPKLGRLVGRDTVWLAENELNDFNYIWKMTLAAGSDTTARVVSRDRILDIPMTFAPNSGDYDYGLMLQIVHKISGVTKQLNWEVKVLGVYASGLLVAETKDEQTTDISLIMSRSYNNDIGSYEKDVIYYDIYGKANNNNRLQGLVSSMAYLAANGNEMLTILVKGKSLVQVEPITMKEADRDMTLFYYQPATFNPQEVFSVQWGNYSILINDGILHFYETRYGMKYSYTSEFNYNLSTVYIPLMASSCLALLFDKKASKFIRFTGRSPNFVIELPATTGGAFDPTNLQGIEPIYGDLGNNSTARCLMQKGGKYFIYEIASNGFVGNKIYDLSNCTDLDKASCYAFSGAYGEFYYSVGNKLYVAILNSDVPVCQVAYDKFGADEVVSHVLMHKEDGGKTTWGEQPDGTPLWRNSKNNLLSVATYNDKTKEGKIYTLPIQYGGNGGIAADKYVHTYDKFGRITAIATK